MELTKDKCKECTVENMCTTGTIPNSEECLMKGRDDGMFTKEECIEYLETIKNFACIHTTCCRQTHHEIAEDKKLFNACINTFEQLIKEHFDNPMFPHCQRLMKRIVMQSECIEELNNQLSRYNEWEMEQVMKRQNPPLTVEELRTMIGKPVWQADLKRYFIIDHIQIEFIEKFYVRDKLFTWLIFEEDLFYRNEVKE